MDFGAPVADQIDPQAGFKTIGNLLSLKQQQQALVGQQSHNQILRAQAQQETQNAQQRSATANFFKNYDFQQHVGLDGTTDLNMLSDPKFRQAAGDNYPAIAKSMVDVKNAQLTGKKSLAELNGVLRDQLMGAVGSLRGDPDVVADNPAGRAKVQQVLDSLSASGGEDAKRVASIYGPMIEHIKPGQLSQAISNFQLQGMDASRQSAAQAPSYQNTGATLQNVNPQSAGGAAPSQLRTTIPPQVVTLPSGQQGAVTGGGASVAPIPSGAATGRGGSSAPPSNRPRIAQDDAPPPNAPRAVQDAYQQSVVQAQSDMSDARKADSQYGTGIHVSNVIRSLSKSTDTGPGTSLWHHMLAGIPGAASTTANDAGADYQTINSMLDRQAAMARSTMGLPATNAGQAAAENLSGTTEFARKALQTKNNLTQALTEGAHQFREGLEKVGGFTSQPSPVAVNNFKAAWTANFDPNVYRAIRAHDEHDQEEIRQLREELGAQGFKTLSVKAANLESLAKTGQLPSR